MGIEPICSNSQPSFLFIFCKDNKKETTYKDFVLWSVIMVLHAKYFIIILAFLITVSTYFISNSPKLLFLFLSNLWTHKTTSLNKLTICHDGKCQRIHFCHIPAWQSAYIFWHILMKLLLSLQYPSSQPRVNSVPH